MNKAKPYLAVLLLGVASQAFATTPSAVTKEADNTGLNERDVKTETLTPEDQAKGSEKDVELTRLIREKIVKDDSLSTNAHNVKIITLNGVVTLRGPVDSLKERNKVAEFARKTAGVKNVRDNLEVKLQKAGDTE